MVDILGIVPRRGVSRPDADMVERAVMAMELSGLLEEVASVCAVPLARVEAWIKEGAADGAPEDVARFYDAVMAAKARFSLDRLQKLAVLEAENPRLLLERLKIETAKTAKGQAKNPQLEAQGESGNKMVMDMLRQIRGHEGEGNG